MTIALCCSMLIFTRNVFVLALLAIGFDFLMNFVDRCSFSKLLREHVKTKEQLEDFVTVLSNHADNLFQKFYSILVEYKNELEDKQSQCDKPEDIILQSVEQELKEDLEEFRKINSRLIRELDNLSIYKKRKDISESAKEIIKQIDKITTIIDKEPIKIRLFIYQYFNFSKELIFLNEELQKDSNKKVYEEKYNMILESFLRYLNNVLEQLNNEQAIKIESSMNVLLKELEKEINKGTNNNEE